MCSNTNKSSNGKQNKNGILMADEKRNKNDQTLRCTDEEHTEKEETDFFANFKSKNRSMKMNSTTQRHAPRQHFCFESGALLRFALAHLTDATL